MNISDIFYSYVSIIECWCSLNHSSIQPTNQLKIALAFNGILLSDYIIGAAREEFLNPTMSRRIRYHNYHMLFFFLLSLIVLLPFVTANTLTELSWLDMDVWWDIGNCDMLARRACIP